MKLLRIFLNNAQKEKYAILDYVLSPVNKEIIENLPHRIKAINEDLAICEIPLKINNNLTYSFTTTTYDDPLKSYYKKIVLYTYQNYLLYQSNIFHLVKYLITNKEANVEDIVYDLNISTSYIYKLIGNFNKVSSEEFDVTIQINKKSVYFHGESNKIIALTFQFCKFFPSGHHITLDQFMNNKIDDDIVDPLRPYLLKICSVNKDCSNTELVYEMFNNIYIKKHSPDELKIIGYDLIQQGGRLIDTCYKLIGYYNKNYYQIKIEDMTFYLVELIKLITSIEVSPKNLIFATSDQMVLKKYEQVVNEEYNDLQNILSESKLPLSSSTLRTLLLFTKPFLEKSKPTRSIQVYVEMMDSIFITQLFIDSISSVFNKKTVILTNDISEANVIITDNPDSINLRNDDTFIYLISDFITEFDNKKYLKFILNMLDIFTNNNRENIIQNVNLLH